MPNTGYPSIDRTHLQGVPEDKLHPTIYPLSMLTTFEKVNEGHFDEPLIEDKGIVHTKQEVKEQAIIFANSMLSLGLTVGDRIAIMTTNCYEGIIATFGANAIGIGVAMFEPSTGENQTRLQEEIKAHQPKVLIVNGKTITWAREVIASYPYLRACLIVDPGKSWITVTTDTIRNGLYCMTPLDQVQEQIKLHSLSPNDDPMVYLKTSGSTSGKPKTLPFSNRAIFAALIYASNSTGIKTRDSAVNRVLCNAPFQHGYGWMTLFINLIGGIEVVLVGGTAKDVAAYHKLRPGYIYATPLTLKQFMESTPDGFDLSCLKAFYCAGASIPEEEYNTGMEFFKAHNSPCEIRNNYGISEGMCIGTASDGVPHLPGTIGKFYVGPEWLIVDENLNEVKYGESGEAIVAAESLCQGYFNDSETTEKSFIKRDSKTFFRTGDYLSLSEDGYVRFVGRERRFFFAQGVTDKVNCETIEQALDDLVPVDQAAVIVVKDKNGVESAKAFVKLVGNDVPSNADARIREMLSEVLQPHQIPQEIVFIDEIPIMESGKVNYRYLENL